MGRHVRSSVRGQAGWLTIARASLVTAQFALLAAASRGLGVRAASDFALGLSFTAPCRACRYSNLRVVHITLRDRPSFAVFLRYRILTCLLGLGIAASVGALYHPVPLSVLMLISLGKAIDSVADLSFAPMQYSGQAGRVFRFTVSNCVLTVGLGVTAVIATHSLIITLVGSLIGSATVAALAMRAAGRIRPEAADGCRISSSWRSLT